MIEVNNRQIDYLEHLVHHRNLRSVLLHGLHSHNDAYKKGLISEDISLADVQERRHERKIPFLRQHTLHDLVSFYFNTRNPMLFKRKNIQEDLVILLVSADIINTPLSSHKFAIFTDGNAGAYSTRFYHGVNNLNHLDTNIIYAASWYSEDPDTMKENRRKRCAEVLIYPRVNISDILFIICPNQIMLNYARNLIKSEELQTACNHIQAEININYFFF